MRWKQIKNYEDLYIVSDEGDIMSLDRTITRKDGITYNKKGKKLNSTYTGDGYYSVILVKDGKQKRFYVHRLVAEAFVPNPDNLNEINHLSEDKKDNRACNLQWTDHLSNCNYGTRNERISRTLKNSHKVFAK